MDSGGRQRQGIRISLPKGKIMVAQWISTIAQVVYPPMSHGVLTALTFLRSTYPWGGG